MKIEDTLKKIYIDNMNKKLSDILHLSKVEQKIQLNELLCNYCLNLKPGIEIIISSKELSKLIDINYKDSQALQFLLIKNQNMKLENSFLLIKELIEKSHENGIEINKNNLNLIILGLSTYKPWQEEKTISLIDFLLTNKTNKSNLQLDYANYAIINNLMYITKDKTNKVINYFIEKNILDVDLLMSKYMKKHKQNAKKLLYCLMQDNLDNKVITKVKLKI